jgi:hypothetical protein
MNFQDKADVLMVRLRSFLKIYTPPRVMGEDEQARAIVAISESMARKIYAMDDASLNTAIDKTFEAVADSHESYAWPTQAAFIKALPFSAEPNRVSQFDDTNAFDMAVKRMMSGHPVGDRYVFGSASSRISAIVGSDILESYRKGLGRSFSDVYRENAMNMIVAKYGEWTAKYV